MRYFLFVVVGILYFSSASSQIILKPTIGSFAFPQDSDHIAPIVRHPNPFFDLSGIQVGDTANEFILYTLSGQRVLLTDILKEGKPLLIMTGSYTCPVFRYNIPTINEVAEKYRKLLNI